MLSKHQGAYLGADLDLAVLPQRPEEALEVAEHLPAAGVHAEVIGA